jgi:hypothetical protein
LLNLNQKFGKHVKFNLNVDPNVLLKKKKTNISGFTSMDNIADIEINTEINPEGKILK